MTDVLPIVFSPLPVSPIGASLATVDASVLLLPLAFVVALAVGLVAERVHVAWRDDRGSRTRRTPHVIPIRSAA